MAFRAILFCLDNFGYIENKKVMDEEFIDKLYKFIEEDNYNQYAYCIVEHALDTEEFKDKKEYHLANLPQAIANMTENRYKEYGKPNKEDFKEEMNNFVTRQRQTWRSIPDQNIKYESDSGS